jgi:hypothetical protein
VVGDVVKKCGTADAAYTTALTAPLSPQEALSTRTHCRRAAGLGGVGLRGCHLELLSHRGLGLGEGVARWGACEIQGGLRSVGKRWELIGSGGGSHLQGFSDHVRSRTWADRSSILASPKMT